jgi:3-deoxy-D-manno-octulosonate cytidylyltransferase
MRTLAVIPCRLEATRFPGKPLTLIHGTAMVEWVYRHARQVSCIDRLVVATDSPRIMGYVKDFGGEALMTSAECQSGTDRAYETSRILSQQGDNYDLVINIQGDEPAMHPSVIEQVIDMATQNKTFDIITAACSFERSVDIFNHNMVKVIIDNARRALYFSRSPIPFIRGNQPFLPTSLNPSLLAHFHCHLGIYAYRTNALARFAGLPIDPIENLEKLEQLRALRQGMSIGVAPARYLSLGVDTPEDVPLVEALLTHNGLFKHS